MDYGFAAAEEEYVEENKTDHKSHWIWGDIVRKQKSHHHRAMLRAQPRSDELRATQKTQHGILLRTAVLSDRETVLFWD